MNGITNLGVLARLTYPLCATVILALASSGCSSNPSRTHRADLLDEMVTADRIQAELNRAGNDFRNVHAIVTNEEVVLIGTVRSPELRKRAEEIARNVHRDNFRDEVKIRK